MLALVTWLGTAGAAVVINEFLPNPDGADGGQEWIELHNTGASAVDLAGWSISSGTTTLSTRYTFGTVSIPAGGFVLLGEEFVVADVELAPGERLALGNASSSGDAVQLVNSAGTSVDTVIYGPNNTDGFLDDTGSAPTTVVAAPGSGQALARLPDGMDANQADDFGPVAVPTPGAANQVVAVGCDPGSSGVVINEFLPDPAGADTDAQWVELLATDGTVDLSGWTLAAGTSSFSGVGTIPAGTVLSAGDYLVVGQAELSSPDVVAPGFSLGNASNADGVQLADCFGDVADTVIYGTDNTDAWIDDAGGPARLAPRAGSGETLGRVPDGVDTDDSSVDVVVLFPTPGGPNDAEPPDCGGLGSGLLVNEFLTNPEGADDDLEWVELFHAGVQPLLLDGWALQSATGTTWAARHTFEALTLQPGDRLLVGGAAVAGATHPLSGSLGNGSGGDGLRVVDCSGFVSDTVIYGVDNTDGLVGDGGEIARSLAPVPPEGGSVQRVEDGRDTNQSGLDFAVADSPSPGQVNVPIVPIPCTGDEGGVRINEFLSDPDGTDDDLEWIELYNNGNEPASVAGWSLAAGTSDYSTLDVVFPAETVVPAGGWLVVGGALVAEADVVSDALSIGNGSTSRDGIRLFDCEGKPVDTVVYGALDEEEAEPGILDDNDQTSGSYGDPGSGLSLFRTTDGLDTDAAADWSTGRPTPGASNVVVASTPTDPERVGGCGAGSGPRDLRAPPGGPPRDAPTSKGCTVLEAPGLVLFLWGLVVARRR